MPFDNVLQRLAPKIPIFIAPSHALTLGIAVWNLPVYLKMPWPESAINQPTQCQALLVTATEPTFLNNAYAPVEEIARSYVDDAGTADYFMRNVHADIRTVDDGAIWGTNIREDASSSVRC